MKTDATDVLDAAASAVAGLMWEDGWTQGYTWRYGFVVVIVMNSRYAYISNSSDCILLSQYTTCVYSIGAPLESCHRPGHELRLSTVTTSQFSEAITDIDIRWASHSNLTRRGMVLDRH